MSLGSVPEGRSIIRPLSKPYMIISAAGRPVGCSVPVTKFFTIPVLKSDTEVNRRPSIEASGCSPQSGDGFFDFGNARQTGEGDGYGLFPEAAVFFCKGHPKRPLRSWTWSDNSRRLLSAFGRLWRRPCHGQRHTESHSFPQSQSRTFLCRLLCELDLFGNKFKAGQDIAHFHAIVGGDDVCHRGGTMDLTIKLVALLPCGAG